MLFSDCYHFSNIYMSIKLISTTTCISSWCLAQNRNLYFEKPLRTWGVNWPAVRSLHWSFMSIFTTMFFFKLFYLYQNKSLSCFVHIHTIRLSVYSRADWKDQSNLVTHKPSSVVLLQCEMLHWWKDESLFWLNREILLPARFMDKWTFFSWSHIAG